jgi:rubrerythrin
VYSANEFLTRVNLMGGDKFPYLDTPISLGKSVVVIGAGNTAMDCLRVAKRLGAPTVRCVYRRSEAEAPARIEELRHAKEEGVEFYFLHAPVEIKVDAEGEVHGMKVQKMMLGEPDERGRRKPIPLDEFVDLECDTVIYALGTNANPIIGQSTPGLALNKWGYIVADDATQATNLPGVFAGGDIVTGGATVILAMGAGRRAAKAIGAYLQSGKKKWPITAEDVDAFVPGDFSAIETATPQQGGSVMLCPKCHQPLEGDESYICCADQSVQWRCSDCAKVSEGFAFPYGACPHCGGKLEILTEQPVENAAALNAIRTAFEIELGGQAFYKQAAADSTDPYLKALFSRFAAMEEEHMATLSRRYHTSVPAPSRELRMEVLTLFSGIEGRPDDPDTLFRIAIGLEKRAVDFFLERSSLVPDGSAERQLYRELAAEEREHVALLSTEFERWRAGKPGIL